MSGRRRIGVLVAAFAALLVLTPTAPATAVGPSVRLSQTQAGTGAATTGRGAAAGWRRQGSGEGCRHT
ncbi:hypothetical protein ACFXGE_20010, partial [Streptomyces sp. NPDC059378]